MAKIICPECGQQVKKCYECYQKFSGGDPIICIGIRGKHFDMENCLTIWTRDRFEEKHTTVSTYAEYTP